MWTYLSNRRGLQFEMLRWATRTEKPRRANGGRWRVTFAKNIWKRLARGNLSQRRVVSCFQKRLQGCLSSMLRSLLSGGKRRLFLSSTIRCEHHLVDQDRLSRWQRLKLAEPTGELWRNKRQKDNWQTRVASALYENSVKGFRSVSRRFLRASEFLANRSTRKAPAPVFRGILESLWTAQEAVVLRCYFS